MIKLIVKEICPLCAGKSFMFIGKEGKIFCYCPCCENGEIKIKREINED